MKRVWLKTGGLLVLVLLASCRTHPDYMTDFRFPIMQGDIEQGRQDFVDLGCHRCHTVNEADLPEYEGTRPVYIELGGELLFAKTYASLVTSIINPSHVVSEEYQDQLPGNSRARMSSPMPFHGEMTVSQLVDVVTFLNASYRLLPGYTEEFYY